MIKPGLHILIALKDEKSYSSASRICILFNCYSYFVCFTFDFKFRKTNQSLPIVKARINQDLKRTQDKTIFTACNVEYKNGEYIIDFVGKNLGQVLY